MGILPVNQIFTITAYNFEMIIKQKVKAND